ncbi:MAG: D-aminoacylase [Rhodothermales bacterium]|nr:D-aminoacylase [Rhodothermales bacterium]MBO6779114.1 D-aminoacylase [Rhodothermales bacterium]
MKKPLLLILAMGLLPQADAQPVYSVILENGLVVDGTGNASFEADVGLIGDRIGAIGDLSRARAATRVDATGHVVAPGFIDIHSHAVGSGAGGPLAARPHAENLIRQGVTSVFGGQDGSSPWPVGEALAFFDVSPAAVNVGLFAGHGTLRARIVGMDDREADPDELSAMRAAVRQAMHQGAYGLSSGLEYAPGMFASTDELAALSEEIAPFGGLYISHVRDEGGALMDSVDELIAISRASGAAAQLTHHKIIGKHRWGGTVESLARVEEARRAGLDITLDVYPYTASSTGLTILFPGWAKDGGLSGLQERLADPQHRARIRQDVIAHIHSERGGDPATIVAARCGFDDSLAGKSLADMARDAGLETSVENAADIAIDLVERGSCQGVFHSMGEEDVARVMKSEHAMAASDGGVPALGVGSPHPRSYGTFARVLAHYVRESGTLTLEEAVARMTSRPAARLGLHDRGELRPGAVADVVVFDPERVQDLATFRDPHRYAVGVSYVYVSGVAALQDGEPTGARPGKSLRKGR